MYAPGTIVQYTRTSTDKTVVAAVAVVPNDRRVPWPGGGRTALCFVSNDWVVVCVDCVDCETLPLIGQGWVGGATSKSYSAGNGDWPAFSGAFSGFSPWIPQTCTNGRLCQPTANCAH